MDFRAILLQPSLPLLRPMRLLVDSQVSTQRQHVRPRDRPWPGGSWPCRPSVAARRDLSGVAATSIPVEGLLVFRLAFDRLISLIWIPLLFSHRQEQPFPALQGNLISRPNIPHRVELRSRRRCGLKHFIFAMDRRLNFLEKGSDAGRHSLANGVRAYHRSRQLGNVPVNLKQHKRRTRSAPSPRWGEGWGEGVSDGTDRVDTRQFRPG